MQEDTHELEHAYDTSLHQKDPLCMMLWIYDEKQGGRNGEKERFKFAIQSLMQASWDNIVQHWLDLAFPPTLRGDNTKRPVANPKTFGIFFKFQYELQKDDGCRKAETYLLQACKELGCSSCASSSHGYWEVSTAKRQRGNREKSGPRKKTKTSIARDQRRDAVNTGLAASIETDSSASTPDDFESLLSETADPSNLSDETMTDGAYYQNIVDVGPRLSDIPLIKLDSPPLSRLTCEAVPGANGNSDTATGSLYNYESLGRWQLPDFHAVNDEAPHNWLLESVYEHEQAYFDAEEEETVGFNISDGYNEPEPDLLIIRPKPPLPIYPPIWARSRQEVCESFGWFRSYQGGVYFNRDIVKGYLLGGFSASRDRFEHEGRLIISHGGGKAACTLSQKGKFIATAEDNQLAQDKSVRALLRTYKESRPLVLVIDERYALFPFDLSSKKVAYAVLGFYTIAHAWAEYQPASNDEGRVVRYKFAFRWCAGQGSPWWIQEQGVNMPTEVITPASRPPSKRAPVKMIERALANVNPSIPENLSSPCTRCLQKSPKVYAQGWACLNSECPLFWATTNFRKLPDRLDYNPAFLELTEPIILSEGLVNGLKPTLPQSAFGGNLTTYACTRGWHCSRCGRLSCRSQWEKYECAHCHLTVSISGHPRSPNSLRGLHVPVPFQDYYYTATSDITFAGVSYIDHGEEFASSLCHTFKLPYERGFIHHIKSCTPNSQPAPDQIFLEYQEQALTGVLPLRRWPMRAHKCQGSLLTNYFSQNSGVPYQYVGGTANTLPWDKAPDAVIKARNLIEQEVSLALNRHAEFNEVLSAAYMERQRMAFHTDSEPGLGPLVAGLSLGSPALMHFRLAKSEQRQIAITFVLRHGDILVMDGAKIQESYEHTVVPSNFRIAATARFIGQSHVTAEA